MEPEQAVAPEEKHNPLFEVTPLSKYLAMLLFVAMPFIGAWIGYNLSPVEVVYVETHALSGDEKEESFSPVQAIENLKASIQANPELMYTCHMETHMIGNEAYRKLQELAYDSLDPICGGGYLHGVIEEAFKENGMEYLDYVVHQYCNDEMTESCLHGVGHGIRTVLQDPDESVAACNKLQATNTDCFDGVFMDIFDADGMKDFVAPSLDEALSVCASITAEAQPSCYFYLPRLIQNKNEIIELCSSEEIGNGWGSCSQGSGVYFMKVLANFDKDTADSWCAGYKDQNQEELCLRGVSFYEKYGNVDKKDW